MYRGWRILVLAFMNKEQPPFFFLVLSIWIKRLAVTCRWYICFDNANLKCLNWDGHCSHKFTIFLIQKGVGHTRDITGRRLVVLAHNKSLNAGVSAAPWLAASHLIEEEPQLGVEQLHVLPTEYLGHKVAAMSQHMGSYVQCLHLP